MLCSPWCNVCIHKISELKFISFNCRGIGDFKKRKDVFGYLRNQDFNICFLQDIHCRKIGVPYFRNAWGTDVLVAPYTNNARGVAILTKNIDVSFQDTLVDPDGNYIITKAKVSGSAEFRLVNIYGPNSDDPNFFEELFRKIERSLDQNDMPVILAGDFNLTLNQNMDNYNYKRVNNARARDTVKDIMAERGLVDIFRVRNPDSRRYTWRVGSPAVKQARLDMFLVSSCLEGYVTKTDIKPGYRSDHSIITMNVDIEKQVKGRGLFKFNASLLKDLEYIKLVKNVIGNTALEYALPVYREEYVKENPAQAELTISASLFFEVLMLTIRRETVSFGIKKKKLEREQERELETEIGELEKELDEKGYRKICDQLQKAKEQLEKIREKRLTGSLVRSRAIWRENSEKPSKYFLTLEKRRYDSRRIPAIKTPQGIIKSQTDILKAFEEHFRYRFGPQSSDEEQETATDYLVESELCEVSPPDKIKLSEPINLSELGSTLFNMKNGTSPGSDGFSVEFYKFFWADIKEFFHAMCMESFANGSLPITLKEGIIVLLPKPNKPRDLLKSYRPITLLNVCYKVISGTIANRLKTVLQNIIDPCQSAYLKGRFIGENVRMIYDIMQFTKQEKISGILLSLDIEAAFDSVSWLFIEEVLRVRNFPSNIIKWFKTLYSGSFARVLYNGHLSEKVNLARSCRQGDALSCYLFILVMDVLAKRVKRNRDISGIRIANAEYKISMYADDTVCLIDPSEKSVRKLFQELGWFAKFSGLRPNLEKTQALWIGAPYRGADTFQTNVTLQWCEKLKILGITFENSLLGILEVYAEKIKGIKSEIEKWKFRNLSLRGKVTIIKSLLISKISYLFATIPNPPQSAVRELTSILYKFLWHGRAEKIKRLSLIKDPSNGGIGMLDLQSYISALKVAWIRRYISTPDGLWKVVAKEVTGKNIEFWRLGQTSLREKASRIKNQFWKEVLSALADFKDAFELDIHQISSSAIFFSEVTKYKRTYVKEWYDNGIRTLNDLLKPDGTLMDYDQFKRNYRIRATFLDYRALLSSLPEKWRISQEKTKLNEPLMDPVTTYIVSKNKGAAHLSDVLIASKTRKLENIWENAWENRLQEVNWKTVYASLRDTPIQYRSTRYKIVSRIAVTNSLLNKMNIKDSDSCENCAEKESLEHKFWHCERVQTFWNSMKRWLIGKDLGDVAEKINMNEVLVGGEKCLIVNHVVSVGVQIIYARKSLSVNVLQAMLRSDFESERYLAIMSERKDKLERKWGSIKNHIFQ